MRHNGQVVPEASGTNGGGNSSSLDDLFNPERLKISQNFADLVGVKKVLLTIPVRKPDRQTFVRVHPAAEYRLDTLVLELKEDREIYLIDPALGSQLPGEIAGVTLFTSMSRQGVLFLWPIRLPDPQGKRNLWNESARKGADLGMQMWVRVAANMSLGAYETFEATGDLPEPEWPSESLAELLKIAFADRFIRSLTHPVVQRLRGAL